MTGKKLIAIVPLAVALAAPSASIAHHDRADNSWSCFPFNGHAVAEVLCPPEQKSSAVPPAQPSTPAQPRKTSRRCAAKRSKARASKRSSAKRCARKLARR